MIAVLFAQDWRVGAVIGSLALAAFAAPVATRNLSVSAVAAERSHYRS